MRLTEKVVSTVGLEAGQDDRIWFDDEITGFAANISNNWPVSWRNGSLRTFRS